MKTLMIHEVHPWMLDVDFSSFDLITFDDGLYTQYLNLDFFLGLGIPLIFFVSTGIISEGEQNPEVIACAAAHKNFFDNGDTSAYMDWDQIKEIHDSDNAEIGGHSHNHFFLDHRQGIKEIYDIIKKDLSDMNEAFKEHNISVDSYCYPYNNEVPLVKTELKKYNINRLFGKERIPIEDLK